MLLVFEFMSCKVDTLSRLQLQEHALTLWHRYHASIIANLRTAVLTHIWHRGISSSDLSVTSVSPLIAETFSNMLSREAKSWGRDLTEPLALSFARIFLAAFISACTLALNVTWSVSACSGSVDECERTCARLPAFEWITMGADLFRVRTVGTGIPVCMRGCWLLALSPTPSLCAPATTEALSCFIFAALYVVCVSVLVGLGEVSWSCKSLRSLASSYKCILVVVCHQ